MEDHSHQNTIAIKLWDQEILLTTYIIELAILFPGSEVHEIQLLTICEGFLFSSSSILSLSHFQSYSHLGGLPTSDLQM